MRPIKVRSPIVRNFHELDVGQVFVFFGNIYVKESPLYAREISNGEYGAVLASIENFDTNTTVHPVRLNSASVIF